MKKISLRDIIFYFGILFLSADVLGEEKEVLQKRQDFAISYEVMQFHNIKTIQSLEFDRSIQIAPKLKIQESVLIKTQNNELLQLKGSDDSLLLVMPETEFKIDGYVNEKKIFYLNHLELLKGHVYFSKKTSELEYAIQSPFFDFRPQSKNGQLKFFVSLLKKNEILNFCNGSGQMKLILFDHETQPDLTEGQSLQFLGQLRENKVDFDILLEGRKVPKGKWGQPSTCKATEALQELARIKAEEKKQRDLAEKKKKAELLKKYKNMSQFLCHNPYGQFGDCFVKKEKKRCVSYRCNAQGEWKDRQILTDAESYLCEQKDPVSKCNY